MAKNARVHQSWLSFVLIMILFVKMLTYEEQPNYHSSKINSMTCYHV